MEYRIITANSLPELQRQTNLLIRYGWEPIGGHQIHHIKTIYKYSGSQIRITEPENQFSQSLIKKT